MAETVVRRPRVASGVAGEGAPSGDVAQLSESGLNLFSLMEDVNDRLKLLDYEAAFLRAKAALGLRPLSRVGFALPTTAAEQFPFFAHLCTWLFALCKREVLDWNEFDDPNTIAGTIVDHLKRIGCPLDVSASRLRPGSGEAVVLVLDYMSALALQHSGFTVLTPVYGTADALAASDAPRPGDSGEVDEDGGDAVLDTVEDDAPVDDEDTAVSSLNDPFASIASSAPLPPPPSSIDPSQWLLEYETAAPLLRAHPASLSTKEWRAHHDSAVKHAQLLSASFDGARTELERLSSVLRAAVERVQAKEKLLNKEHEALVQEMRAMQTDQEAVSAEYAKASEELSAMSRRLKAATEEVEAMKDSIGRKNERMQDTTPVRAVSAACKELRKEVLDMDVRIGIMSQSVSAIRQRRQKDRERLKGKQERERSRKGNGNNQRTADAHKQQPTAHVRYDY